eukprot:symbB.v1.2.035960.t1/scaffold4966.1/size32331/1
MDASMLHLTTPARFYASRRREKLVSLVQIWAIWRKHLGSIAVFVRVQIECSTLLPCMLQEFWRSILAVQVV